MDSGQMAVAFLVLALILSAAEIAAPGLVLLPFGLGAGVAAVAGFLGADPLIQVAIFVVTSAGFFFALRPIGRRLNESTSDQGVGVKRLDGAAGVVLEEIGARDSGMVRIDREEWRADSAQNTALAVGANVIVVEVRGTRVIVEPSGTLPWKPPTSPPLGGEK